MNPTPFSPPQGAVGQVNAQMNAGQPALNQVTTQSPNFNPSLQAPPNSPMPNKSPMSNFSQGLVQRPGMGQPSGSQKPLGNQLHARADTIVKALTSHLAALDKILSGSQQESHAG